jgi:hypothetical protein
MVEARWKDRHGNPCKSMALLEDISPSGACLQFEEPVPVGSEISWDGFRGRVTYCIYREIGHFAGILFSSGTRWSAEDYQPPHLLDPRRISDAPCPD